MLLLTVAVPSQVAGSPANAPVDWTTMNANQDHTNYVAQSQIGASDVQSLSLAWTFPFPAAAPHVAGLSVVGQGSISPPLVVNGTVYLVTNYLTVYAFNGETGAVEWSYPAVLNTTGLPLSPLTGHMHGINYYKGDIWVSLPDCSVLGLNALTGAVETRITDICKNVPGNSGYYDSSGVPPVFYGDTMIWSSSVSEGTDVGRGFVAAYNITDGALLWRWYVTPASGGDPNWDANSCSTNSTSTCHGNVAPYPGDWGKLGTTTTVNGTAYQVLAGAGPSFGDPVVDAKHGIVFVSTSQASPDWNGTYRPGPNLYADSIVALNATNGNMLWFYQTTPHDLYDFDCGWNTVLGNVTTGAGTQEAVFKACKNGYLYALSALTGKLLWYFDPPTVARSLTGNANYVATGNYSATQPWINYPSTKPFEQCPGENGAIEADIAYAYSMIYVATMNFCTFGQVSGVNIEGAGVWGVSYLSPDFAQANTTIYAVHASTGTVAWSYSMPSIPYRGWLTASNGLVFAGALDGSIHILDAATGREVYDLYVGPSLYESPTIGSGIDGQVFLYQLTSASAYGAFSGGVPGDLMAYTVVSPPQPGWEGYAAPVAVGILAAAVVFLIVENRSLRRSRV
ncbi:MAG: PQQ-binding-like beta-propeller repeat protein [Nitrososphaerota archaeon]|nr:PQQ-binding-like beta-propeller repeat protein [Nitrososphaerota archaeon]MDG6966763.1 PQQ-binding-like beta-propeller repeat protein [Nitrososphaerota archaeon]MDG6979176.1 PQQ-binding-like beta-propeller repeat protein [Nitrososphaerota archaeon]